MHVSSPEILLHSHSSNAKVAISTVGLRCVRTSSGGQKQHLNFNAALIGSHTCITFGNKMVTKSNKLFQIVTLRHNSSSGQLYYYNWHNRLSDFKARYFFSKKHCYVLWRNHKLWLYFTQQDLSVSQRNNSYKRLNFVQRDQQNLVCLGQFDLYVDTTTWQLTRIKIPRRLKQLTRWIEKTRHSKYSFVLSAHSEIRTMP